MVTKPPIVMNNAAFHRKAILEKKKEKVVTITDYLVTSLFPD